MFITVPRRWRVWNTKDNHEQLIDSGRYKVEQRLVETGVDPAGRMRRSTFLLLEGTPLGLERDLWEIQSQSQFPDFRVIIEK